MTKKNTVLLNQLKTRKHNLLNEMAKTKDMLEFERMKVEYYEVFDEIENHKD